jgi:hypothetical protein
MIPVDSHVGNLTMNKKYDTNKESITLKKSSLAISRQRTY